jgi:hypothetical protein
MYEPLTQSENIRSAAHINKEKYLENQVIDTRGDSFTRCNMPVWIFLWGEEDTTSKLMSLESNWASQRDKWILSAMPTRRTFMIFHPQGEEAMIRKRASPKHFWMAD